MVYAGDSRAGIVRPVKLPAVAVARPVVNYGYGAVPGRTSRIAYMKIVCQIVAVHYICRLVSSFYH